MLKIKRTAIVVLVCVLTASLPLFLIYARQDNFRSMFKENLEVSFSGMTGADVSIKAISGNPFRKILFKRMVFDFGRYSLDFNVAKLEYSLFDIISGNRPSEGETETVMTLEQGSLRLENNVLISRQISGRVILKQGKIILDKVNFKVFDQLTASIEGEITTKDTPYKVELIIEAKPFFDRDKPLFEKIRINARGSLENINLRGEIKRSRREDIHFSSYVIYGQEILDVGLRIGVETERAYINHLFSMDTEFDTKNSTFSSVLIPNEGKIIVNGDYSKWDAVKADIENQHLKIAGLDFSNIAHLLVKVVFKDSSFSHFLIDVNTEASVLNYSPVDEIASSFLIDKSFARVIYFTMGNKIALSGSFNIKPPRTAQVKISFSGFNMEEPFLVSDKENPGISGMLSGDILVRGSLSRPEIEVKLAVKEGCFGDICYDNMLINGDGTWPYLRIYDSRMACADSSLMLEGEVDVRQITDESFMENIAISTDDDTIKWEGWDITRADEARAFSLKRGLSNGFKVGFKTYMDDETKYELDKQRDEFQVEYELLDDDENILEFKAKEDEEFLGFKKRYSF